MKRKAAWCVMGGFAALLVVLLARSFAGPHPDPADDDEDEESIQAPSRVVVINGQTALKLTPRDQAGMGVTVATLAPASERRRLRAPAVVLSAQDLASQRQAYVTLQNRLRKARISAALAREEYQRLDTLYQDHQNASRKDRDAAESALRSDQADVRSALQALDLQAASIRLAWGDRVAQWVASGSPELEQLLDQRESLVEVTIPAEDAARVPPSVVLEPINEPGGAGAAAAHLISAFPHVDPRLQGAAFLYSTVTRPGLAPGTNVAVRLTVGGPRRGVVIPAAAVTWWQGKTWLYQEAAPGEFVRMPVPADQPTEAGYFTTAVFKAGDKVVVTGVQALLSEEFRSRIQPQD